MNDSKSPSSNRRAVYTIIERDGVKARWIRIGIAFINRDQSINVILDALPVSGTLHIRDFTPRDGEEATAGTTTGALVAA